MSEEHKANETTTKPKRTVSPELKAKMRAGRERAAAERKAASEYHAKRMKLPLAPKHAPTSKTVAPTEFFGITKNDCPVDCTAERCVITGVGFCGHPCKGALQPEYMSNRDTVERYNRARKHLAHVELDKRP